MDRIKSRIALVVAATALASAFMAVPAAASTDSCYPLPEQYCNTMEWYRRCVFAQIWYGYNDPWCQA